MANVNSAGLRSLAPCQILSTVLRAGKRAEKVASKRRLRQETAARERPPQPQRTRTSWHPATHISVMHSSAVVTVVAFQGQQLNCEAVAGERRNSARHVIHGCSSTDELRGPTNVAKRGRAAAQGTQL